MTLLPRRIQVMNHLLAPESDQVEKIDKVIYQALHLQWRMFFTALSHQIHRTPTLHTLP